MGFMGATGGATGGGATGATGGGALAPQHLSCPPYAVRREQSVALGKANPRNPSLSAVYIWAQFAPMESYILNRYAWSKLGGTPVKATDVLRLGAKG
jgi:hypothetical protein